MDKIEVKKLADETEEQFLWRIGQAVDSGEIRSWSSINKEVNTALGIDESDFRDESSFRKRYQAAKKFYDGCFSKMENAEYQKKLDEMNRELQRNAIKFRDNRNAWNKQNYIDARIEETLDMLGEDLRSLGRVNFENHCHPIINSENEMIIGLFDLHIGQSFSNLFGEYDSDIAAYRIGKYIDEIREIAKLYNVKSAHIISGGDQLSGNIHLTVQISNKENVIEQIKKATELISSFCHECTNIFENVFFYSVVGNHTRLTKKDDAVKDERLDDIVSWAVGLSLSHIDNFHMFTHRKLDSGIADLNVCGKIYLAVHGDHDPMTKTGVNDLCAMIGFFPEGIIKGHMHYPAYNEFNGVKVIQSGSLAGSGDDHTIESRLSGKASQTVLVCNSRGIKVHIPVTLS